ncbi:MAG: hypothetical protein JXB25_08410 [Deltaproteobacteria bacterium]|nr:hypothetical protein [Deltaproteobacteria bacterium]
MAQEESPFKNLPGFQTLSKEVFSAKGIPSPDLDQLFEFIGVVNSLQGLLKVLENFSRACSHIPRICTSPKWFSAADRIGPLAERAQAILQCRDSLANLSPVLDQRSRKKSLRPFFGMVGAAPLYVTLGYVPRDRTFLERFDLLLAQVLVARAVLIARGKSQDFSALMEKFLISVRGFSKEPLEVFPSKPLTPEAYLSHLRSIPGLASLTPFFSAVQALVAAQRLESLISPGPEEEESGGVMAFSSEPQLFEAPGEGITVAEEFDHPDDDLEPAEEGVLYFFPDRPVGGLESNNFSSQAQQIAASRAMENQLLHYDWTGLNQQDIQTLLKWIFASEVHSDHQDLGPKALLGMMLFFGFSAERLARLGVAQTNSRAVGECYLAQEKKLRLASQGPHYKTPLAPQTSPQSFTRGPCLELDLPQPLAALLDQLVASRPTSQGENLFGLTAAQINRSCTQAFSRLQRVQPHRLTLNRVQSHMERLLSRLPRGDLAAAGLALGKDIYLARTRIHYASFDSGALRQLHRQACLEICRQGGTPSSEPIPPARGGSCHLGTPFRPKASSIRSLVANLKKLLRFFEGRPSSREALIQYHNAYTLYTVLMIAYSTGYRAVNDPYIPSLRRDETTGFCVIRDKDSADFYHCRLAWLPKVCLRQLHFFERHVQQLLGSRAPQQEQRAESLFFLSPEGRPLPATRGLIEEQLRGHGFFLPPNAQRHFLKSELQERGCSVEAIELLLGHWNLGQEGWTETSALSPLLFRDELESHLPPLLERVGLIPVAGLRKPSRMAIDLSDGMAVRPLPARNQTPLLNSAGKALAAQPPGEVWQEVRSRNRVPDQSRTFQRWEVAVLSQLLRQLPRVYAGDRDLSLSNGELSRLLRCLKHKGIHPRQTYRRLNFLIDGLKWGQQQLNWKIDSLPLRPVIIPKGRNRIRPAVMEELHGYRAVEKVFLADLEKPLLEGAVWRLGRILTSAILYGGLNHRPWAEAFVKALLQRRFFQWEELLWVDLWTVEPGKDLQEQWMQQRNPQIYRRWLADPLTQLLIYRFSGKPVDDEPLPADLGMDAVYRRYASHIQEAAGFRMPPLTELLAQGNAWATLHLPPFLAAYAAGTVSSASLPEPAWLRVLTGKHHLASSRPLRSVTQKTGRGSSPEERHNLIRQLARGIRDRGRASCGGTEPGGSDGDPDENGRQARCSRS